MRYSRFRNIGRSVSKYRSTRTEIDGKHFPSRLEARRYQELVQLQKAGVVLYFVRHPRFDLPGGVKYEADFLVVWHIPSVIHGIDTGTAVRVTVEDCKGVETDVFKIKKRQMAECYPNVKFKILTARDVM